MVLNISVAQEEPIEGELVVARINARLQPLDRYDMFEDTLEDQLRARGLGEVTGGGTQFSQEEGIEFCDVEVVVPATDDATLKVITDMLEEMGAPKGSNLIIGEEGRTVPFGKAEGVALYLNGIDLDDEVYEQCDVEHIVNELNRLMDGAGKYQSYWEGPHETALYFYGPSAAEMQARMAPFVAEYPLCQKSRVEQIA